MGRLQNNPSIGWVHPKTTHAHPVAWGNKKTSSHVQPSTATVLKHLDHRPSCLL
jgi:hypothetical protein